MCAPALENELAREVRAGLTAAGQKTLPCGLLYDDIGSALFEAITLLPEYGLARADARIIRAHAGQLAEMLPRGLVVAELGSGSGVKTRAILEALPTPVYFPIDLSRAALARCVAELGALAAVEPIEATYLEGLGRAAARCAPGQALLALFLGSTIGNFTPAEARAFLARWAPLLGAGGGALIAVDLKKNPAVLDAAYNDTQGVTAEFNLNVLRHINRALGADFDLRAFRHDARYVAAEGRIEMHLTSLKAQRVMLAGRVLEFRTGETIHTENSYKYEIAEFQTLARAAGFEARKCWTDDDRLFAVHYFALS